MRQLPERFSGPLTEFTLAEVNAMKQAYELEVQRVARICTYFQREIFSKRKPQPRKAAKLRSIK